MTINWILSSEAERIKSVVLRKKFIGYLMNIYFCNVYMYIYIYILHMHIGVRVSVEVLLNIITLLK